MKASARVTDFTLNPAPPGYQPAFRKTLNRENETDESFSSPKSGSWRRPPVSARRPPYLSANQSSFRQFSIVIQIVIQNDRPDFTDAHRHGGEPE